MTDVVVFSVHRSTTTLWWLLYVCARGDAADVLVAADTLEDATQRVIDSGLVEWDYEKPIVLRQRVTEKAYAITGEVGVRVLSEPEAMQVRCQQWYPRDKATIYKLSKRNARRKRRKKTAVPHGDGPLNGPVGLWKW